jgi:hypothetical protein
MKISEIQACIVCLIKICLFWYFDCVPAGAVERVRNKKKKYAGKYIHERTSSTGIFFSKFPILGSDEIDDILTAPVKVCQFTWVRERDSHLYVQYLFLSVCLSRWLLRYLYL